jgi:hypothetical protein
MSSFLRSAAFFLTLAVLFLAYPELGNAQTWRTMTSARQVRDLESLDVQIRYGAGTLEVGTADAPLMYQMEVRYDEEVHTPVATYDPRSRELELGVRTTEGARRGLNFKDGSATTIRLTRAIPLDLDLEFGAGKADIQLGGLSLKTLSVSTGASETTIGFEAPNAIRAERITIEAGAADLRVENLGNARSDRIVFNGGVGGTVLDFGGVWEQSAEVAVQMGIGSVTLRLPRSLGVRIDRSSFLATFNAPDLVRRENSYFNDAWQGAERRLTIDLNAALGSIDIQWID